MPSFDVVSQIDAHELANAVDQANRDLSQRFDFKDTGAKFELEAFVVTMHAQVEFQLRQMLEILKMKFARRGIDVRCLELEDAETTLATARQKVILRHGIDHDTGRRIGQLVKEAKLKVQAAIQGDKVRVTGKQRDDLQAAITLLRKAEVDRPLQFENFRD
jgi:hypothetical protein